MKPEGRKIFRCAIYTRKSTEHGLEQEFNSLDAQREACQAYIKSQASQGWMVLPQPFVIPPIPAATSTALPSKGCCAISKTPRSTSSWSTKSID